MVAGVRRAAVARHRRRHRVPVAPGRGVAALSRLQPAALQHHRGDHRAALQQIRPATQFRDVRLNFHIEETAIGKKIKINELFKKKN